MSGATQQQGQQWLVMLLRSTKWPVTLDHRDALWSNTQHIGSA